MSLLERREPLAILESQLAGARSHGGRLVLVAGEAGIGKSSLVQAFCDQHAPDAPAWWGACDALNTPRPLGPLHDIARIAGGELAALLAGDAPRYQRFNGLLDALSAPGPVIVVVEDAHWADDATRDLLVFLARRVATTNALVVVTFRDDELGPAHPLRATLGHLATFGDVSRITLAPLSEATVAALAVERDLDPVRVYEVTRGNAFFVAEVLASGRTTVPTTVRDAVLARAAPLSPSAREALDVAAVVPHQAELNLVREVARSDAATIDECERAGLLRTSGRSVRFRHELARLAVEEAIPGARATKLHAGVLEYLDKQGYPNPARVAYHAEQAADPAAVVRAAPVAADQAARVGAHREAQAQLARALRHADVMRPSDRAELLERYAEQCNALGMFSTVVEVADRALKMWRELGDVEQVARTTAWRAGPLWNAGRFGEAYQSVEDALGLLDERSSRSSRAFVCARAASLNVIAGDVTRAVEQGRRAVVLAEQDDDAVLLTRSLCGLGTALWTVDPGEAEGVLLRALQLARRTGNDVGASTAMGRLGSGAGEIRYYALADRWLRECASWCADRDLGYYVGHAVAWSARSAFEQGRWSEATDALGQLQELGDVPHTRTTMLTVAGRLRVRRGDPDAATPLEGAWRLAGATEALQRLWPVVAGRAEAVWLAGRPEHIPELVADTYELAVRKAYQPWAIGELAYWMWRAGELDAAPSGAAEPYAYQINGDWRAAALAWDALGCPYEAALARADSIDPDDLSAAFEVFARLGAAPMADAVAARLRERGVHSLPRRPTRATLENPAMLTARELEVLNLVVDGRTNPEIAAALHISAKTAGHHVSAILAKLGVRTRREAARTAREEGVIPASQGSGTRHIGQ